MKSFLTIITISTILNLAQIYGQSGWRADVRDYHENNFGVHELNVSMIADLYDDDILQPVLPTYKYEFFKRYILLPDPEWIAYAPQWGINTQGTHAYQDSTIVPEGKFVIYCKITLPDDITVNSDVITIPWYSVLPDQQKFSGSSFGSIDYWYKGSFKDNNGLNEIYIPRYDPKVLQADINVVSSPPEKYNYWTGNFGATYYKNFVRFSPNELLLTQMLGQFNYINNKTVRAKVDNNYLDVIQFKDPWLRDYDAQPFGIRNQGLGAVPQPLVNDENNLCINTNHQGVLLNQEIAQNKPYYSIKIPSSIYLPQTGQTHKIYLQNWDVSGASLQYPNSIETGVVFTSSSGANIIANLKATQLSNTPATYNNTSQNKFIKTPNGYLHNVYESIGDVYYERSIDIDGGTTWVIMNDAKPINPYPDYGEAKSPSLAYSNDGNDLIYITYQSSRDEGITGPVVMLTQYQNGAFHWHRTVYDLTGYSFSEDYQPVVVAMNGVVLVVFNPPSPSTLGLIAREYLISSAGNITAENSRTLPNVDASSCYPSITAASGQYHLAYQQAAFSIKYLRWSANTNPLTSSYSSTPSTGSGYSLNTEPSISLAYYNPVISWEGAQYTSSPQAVLRRGTLSGTSIIWSDFLKVGSNANYVHNNSAYYTPPSTAEKTVMCWGENNSIIKWVKRTFDSGHTTYSTPANLSHTGIRSQITTGSDYDNMKANMFRYSAPLYYFTQSTTDFSVLQEQGSELNKIAVDDTIVTFGRSGVTDINGIEFVFNIGDVFVEDSIIQFIDKPDTIVYASSNELNEFTRTNNFTLNPGTNFYFSNIYYVVQKSDPDTAMSTNDVINFKVELVNAITDQVVGTFDNITYNKTNLEKYANIDYEVDCSGIIPGDYYLGLVTYVNGNANYALANIISDNTTLAKKSFNKVNFMGSEIPIAYELSNNFPNPFNPSTTIRYQIPQDGIVTLKIYDILGSEVATLVNEEKVAGKYEVNFNASSLASGVYIYKIKSGNFSASKKLVLLK